MFMDMFHVHQLMHVLQGMKRDSKIPGLPLPLPPCRGHDPAPYRFLRAMAVAAVHHPEPIVCLGAADPRDVIYPDGDICVAQFFMLVNRQGKWDI